MPKIDVNAVEARKGSSYPAPHGEPCAERVRKRLGDAGGLEITFTKPAFRLVNVD
jgi:uncharacterized cupin superfamily protein